MSETRWMRAGVAMACGLALAGCLRLERPRPEKRYYMIEAERAPGETRREAATEGALRVRRLTVSPAFEGASFVYRTGEAEYESDYYHGFFIAPDAMLTDQVARWMEGSGLFGRVTGSGSPMRGEYLLEGRVGSLYGDYRDGEGAAAVIELQLVLLRDSREGPEVVHHGAYGARERLGGGGAEALVAAWSAGLAKALAAAEADLARVLAEQAEGPGEGEAEAGSAVME